MGVSGGAELGGGVCAGGPGVGGGVGAPGLGVVDLLNDTVWFSFWNVARDVGVAGTPPSALSWV